MFRNREIFWEPAIYFFQNAPSKYQFHNSQTNVPISQPFFILFRLQCAPFYFLYIVILMSQRVSQQMPTVIRAGKPKFNLNIKSRKAETSSATGNACEKKNQFCSEKIGERKKKPSDDIKDFDYMSVLRDKSIEGGFEDLFELGEKLGEGAQSEVFRCTERETGSPYAVKVCKKHDQEFFQDVRANYQILMELDHRSIIRGRFLFMNERRLSCRIVMELCEFPTLRQHLRQHGPLGEERAALVAGQLLDCLSYMERKGVCHRDLKPENVLYDHATGEIKLIDFELARMRRYSHEKLELLSKCGTLSCRAPEAFKGEYGMPVDMWALGLIVFEMLTGEHPFKTPYSAQTIKAICQKEIDFDSYNLSKGAVKFLRKTLEKNPQKRMKPTQALSSSFILRSNKKTTRTPKTKHLDSNKQNINKLFESVRINHNHLCLDSTNDEDDAFQCASPNFYDEDKMFAFINTFNKDIGVRRCQID